jgi:HD superfamily phosphodiesterase
MNGSKLLDFVVKACEGRDPSHGAPHMQIVAQDSLKIFDLTVTDSHPLFARRDELRELTEVAAYLHDVPDHKYDHDGTLEAKCRAFLADDLGYSAEKVDLVMNIVMRVSFSKEEKAYKSDTPLDWPDVLGDYVIVRHIVSDADKIQAIGDIGIERCAQYTMEHQPGIDRASLKQDIHIHFDEKLGRLYGEFIRTEAGKAMAKPHHDRMLEILENLDNFLDNL